MTEEIKEKQEYLKHIFYELQDYANKEYASPLELVDIECELLLNYITNLQKEKDNYKSRNEKVVEYIETAQKRDESYEACSLYIPDLLNILKCGDE